MAKKIDGEGRGTPYTSGEIEVDFLEEQEESPKKNGRGSTVWAVLRPVVIVLVSLVLVLLLVYAIYDKVRTDYFDPVDETSVGIVEVTIPRNSSLTTISEILEEEGIIRNQQVFKLYVDFSDMSSKLRAGTYSLSKSMTFDDIIYELRQGIDTSATVDVTFVEGGSIATNAQVLMQTDVLKSPYTYQSLCASGEEFSSYSFIQAVLEKNAGAEEPRRNVLEGYLFPDTYQFFYDSSEKTVITRQLDRFKEVFNRQFQKRAEALGMSVDEVVVLASIIEKEAKPADFERVSAVFHNRLNSEEMRLDSDATLNYYLNVDRLVLTDSELDTDTRYNTRMYGGLPPGPICNPGRAALMAALYPDEEYMDEGYYYFTLTDPDTGELVFTKTLDEHNAEVEKYKPLYEEADREKAAEQGGAGQ